MNDLTMFEPLHSRRVLLYTTGCIGAMFLPQWVNWCHETIPELELKVVVSRSARRFIAKDTLRVFAGDVLIDQWGPDNPLDMHIQLSEWPEAYLVHPASMSFISRLSLGLCDTPLMLAMQGSTRPIVVAASTPPNFVEGHVWEEHQQRLADRANITLIPPLAGHSAMRPGRSGSPATLFTEALSQLATVLTPQTPVAGMR